jgi:cytochrome P450
MAVGVPPGPAYPSLIQALGFWSRPLPYLERCRNRYGKRFTLKFPGSPPFVMLSEPDEIKQVFTAPPDVLHPGEGARILEPIVGTHSVILLDGDAHMEQRKLLLPAFHGERIERLQALVESVTEREVASWNEGAVELHPRMQALTLEIILRAVFGLRPGAMLDEVRSRLAEMLRFGERFVSLLPPPPKSLQPVLSRVGPFAAFMRTRFAVDELIFQLIAERRDEEAEGDDVLAMLLAARHEDGTPMSDEEVRDELLTMLVAGHETTATSLSWAFERLSRAPEIRARLTESLDDGDDTYLMATIYETLRCRPVLPNAAPRLVKQPIEVGGHTYPVGVCLVANSYLVQHDPDIYPDPYRFAPERWLDQKPGTYTWIPFGGGRRRCLGASFAMLEMRAVLAGVMRSKTVGPVGGEPERARRRNITIRPEHSGHVRVTERPRDRNLAAA